MVVKSNEFYAQIWAKLLSKSKSIDYMWFAVQHKCRGWNYHEISWADMEEDKDIEQDNYKLLIINISE